MTELTSRVPVPKEEYLKRYLSSDTDTAGKPKKKKKKAPIAKANRLQIIDVDIGMKDIKPAAKDNSLVEEEEDDEVPVVAEVIDDRPKIVKIREQYSSSQWKRLGNDSDENNQNSVSPDLNGAKGARRRYDSDSDCSPPRRNSANAVQEASSPHKRKNTSKIAKVSKDSDDDLSPVRPCRKSDSDLSPERPRPAAEICDSDSDFSPPRKSSSIHSDSPRKHLPSSKKSSMKSSRWSSRSPSRHNSDEKKRSLNKNQRHTPGTSSERTIREVEVINLREDKTEEEEKKRKEKERLDEMKAKYSEWGKGLAQKEQQERKLESDLYEMSKPLARFEGDEDLDRMLKEAIHNEDPMFEYMKKKNRKVGAQGNSDRKEYPKYSGPPPPPNRYGILPGHRWDGVDRSNGFEKKYFASVSNSASKQEESYLWSVQDM